MFDLFRSQQKAVRYVLGGLLLIVAASMVTYLIPNSGFTSTTSGGDNVIAEVGGEQITIQEAQTAIDRLVNGGQLPRESAEVFLPQYVDRMVGERAALLEYERMGLTASDDEVLSAFATVFPQLFQNGKLTSTASLEQLLATQQNLTLQGGIEMMRRQVMQGKAQRLAVSTVIVTPQEVDQALTLKHRTAKIEYVAFPPAKFRDQVKPTPEEVRASYEKTKAAYTLPEKRSFQVLLADQAKVEQGMTVSEAQLRAAYAGSMDNYRTPERVKVRHILLMTQGKSDSEKKPILAKAQGFLKQVKAGGNFAEIAKKNSEDPGSGAQGGDLGFIVRGQTVPEFEKFAFSAKVNDISDVVTTQYGYHIIQVTEKEPARVKPFDEVKTALADELKKQGVADKIQTMTNDARTALIKAPGSAAEIAKQFGMELITANQLAAGEPVAGLGPAAEVDGALSTMKPNDVSEALVLPGNRMAVVVLTSKTAPRPAEFAEVQDKVRDSIVTEKSIALANAAAQEAGKKIQGGQDLEAVAKASKLDVTKSTDFTINDSVEGIGPAQLLADVYEKKVGATVGPLNVSGRNIVYKVIGKQDVNPKDYAHERDAVVQELKQQKARTQYELFEDSLVAQAQADKKIKIHTETVKRLAAAYRVSR
jgi:peptidyl-prolyl cis-trans isomerase D